MEREKPISAINRLALWMNSCEHQSVHIISIKSFALWVKHALWPKTDLQYWIQHWVFHETSIMCHMKHVVQFQEHEKLCTEVMYVFQNYIEICPRHQRLMSIYTFWRSVVFILLGRVCSILKKRTFPFHVTHVSVSQFYRLSILLSNWRTFTKKAHHA